jgi:hypothetical protein
MALAEGTADLRGVLASCFACEAVPRGACALCGRLFCDRHGGVRWVLTGRGLGRRPVCDNCTPNQTRMRLLLALAVTLFAVGVVVFMLLAADVVTTLLGTDGLQRPQPVEPPPVRPVPAPG